MDSRSGTSSDSILCVCCQLTLPLVTLPLLVEEAISGSQIPLVVTFVDIPAASIDHGHAYVCKSLLLGAGCGAFVVVFRVGVSVAAILVPVIVLSVILFRRFVIAVDNR